MHKKTEIDYRIGNGLSLGQTHVGKQEGFKEAPLDKGAHGKALEGIKRREAGNSYPSCGTGVEK